MGNTVINGSNTVEADPEERNEVLEAIARGFVWMEEIESGKVGSVSALADREGVDEAYVRRLLVFACAHPSVIGNAMNSVDLPQTMKSYKQSVTAWSRPDSPFKINQGVMQ